MKCCKGERWLAGRLAGWLYSRLLVFLKQCIILHDGLSWSWSSLSKEKEKHDGLYPDGDLPQKVQKNEPLQYREKPTGILLCMEIGRSFCSIRESRRTAYIP